MSIESYLIRKFEIRFTDARSIVNEAKAGLDIYGYLGTHQEREVTEEAIKIFRERDSQVQTAMRRLKADLDNAKLRVGSAHSSTIDMDTSVNTNSSSSSFASSESKQRRRGGSTGMWSLVRRR